MMRILLLLFSFLVVTTISLAQQRTISGTITDAETGETVPGASVLVLGTTNGTITDFDGKFSLTVDQRDTLQISFVGYANYIVPVAGTTNFNIGLSTDVEELAEVVVIGYGQVEKRDATGAVASVKSEDFNGGVIASPEQLFQGKAAGVQITGNSGEPGAGVNIRIRGSSSVRNGNGPLYVVDGIPLTSSDVSSGGVDLGRGKAAASNPLTFLNPSDIASIDILKDASATAIYGSRGANGVVIITTKSGKGAKASVTYSASASLAHVARTFDLLNAQEFLDGAVARGGIRTELDFGSETDWQKEIFQTGISTKHDVAYGNGYKNGDYRLSVSYGHQGGIIDKSELDRYSARLNLNHRMLDDKLKLGFQGTISRVNNSQVPLADDTGFEGDLLAATYMANPTWPGDPDFQPETSNVNPLSYLKYSEDVTQTDRALIGLTGEYQLLDPLSFKVNVGLDRTHSIREAAISGDLNLIGRQAIPGNGKGARSDWNTDSDLVEAYFNFVKDLGNAKVNAVLGYSYQQFKRDGTNNVGWGYSTSDLSEMHKELERTAKLIRSSVSGDYQQWGYQKVYDENGIETGERLFVNRLFPTPTSEVNDSFSAFPVSLKSITEDVFEEVDELQSYFVRVNYTLLDRYMFTGTVRTDGSSKFGSENQYGIFPSLALGWRISDESFAPSFFQDLKLRAGWGITGNQEIPHNLHQARQRYGAITVGDNGNVAIPSLTTIAFANPDLQWEQTIQTNIGFDFGVMDGRLNGTVDYYNKVTTNLLIKITSAQPAPQPFYWANLDAEVVNTGFEVTLNYNILSNNALTWDVSGNYSNNSNEVSGLTTFLNTGQINGQGLTGAFAQRIANDQPLYAYYLREFSGFDADGFSIYEGGDVQKFIGKSPLPKTNVGLSTNLAYKNWNLNVYAYGQFGGYVYNNTENALFTSGALGSGRNVIRDVIESNESNLNAPDVSTRFLEKSDFVRIQNFALGYNFNTESIAFLEMLSLSATVQNLFLFTNYSGLDPEVNNNKALDDIPSFGIEYSPYPRPRVYTIGLNAKF
ncbi:SusC/RagA family TonB-linked outer membrane protein [Marinoscillum sp. MHG1-6]|uniref:SusC/RagA family TonB-linked outer membrane protein n=1 Tax=Marinoscillum sp. MHG1-6 TaxID=2959627 RepID=UPI0021583299|nr:SusC/RagA family TonB-linked outer membrane protein [Marinoscillum sp. MHG1-6]